jgi:hypothetical protein
MLTAAELEVLERRRTSPYGIDRASVALLVDRDATQGQAGICAIEADQRSKFERLMPPQPGRFVYAPCDIVTLAAYDVLCHPPPARRLEPFKLADEPQTAGARWDGCDRGQIELALALLAWFTGDEVSCARRLIRCRPRAVLDLIVTDVTTRLVTDRIGEIGDVLTRRGSEYSAAMAGGLWKEDPDGFLHVRLLAALKVAAERGRVDLKQLPDTIPYVPLWFLLTSPEEPG